MSVTDSDMSNKESVANSVPCLYCGGRVEYAYNMGAHALGYCKNCHAVGVLDMPSDEEIFKYYQGFNFQTNPRNYQAVRTEKIRTWMSSLLPTGKGNMLDVGGGGGFFASAFEEFQFGESTYIDLDAEACEFARSEMGLKRVICDSVENINLYTEEKSFEFIYCRHVIEHLRDPVQLMKQCAELLSPTGVLILQCPNGPSKEGILFPSYWMKFLRIAKESNNWSKVYAAYFSMTSRYGWGIDPIRHLWAISGKAIKAAFDGDNRFKVRTKSASLTDNVFSPYWKASNRWDLFAGASANILAGRVFQGMHLIAEVRRNEAVEC